MTTPRPRILVIGAHPDDCEYHCGGTAALWRKRGDRVRFVSLTNGQSGHHALSPARLIRRRASEARHAARLIGAESRIMPIPDGHLEPRLEYRMKVIRLIREFRADLVITHRSNDYHPDHRYTSQLVQDSAFLLTVPHVAPRTPALRANPVILYMWDYFQQPAPFRPDVAVDIDDAFDTKLRMLHQHESQFYEWLPWLEGRAAPPRNERARLAFLRKDIESRDGPPVADCCRRRLIARYGRKRGRAVQHAEAFEVSEYGSPLTPQKRRQLFGSI